MSKLSLGRSIFPFCIFLVATAMALPAQDEQLSTNSVTFTSLFSFNGADGETPFDALVQGLDGNLYGTTYVGGANSNDLVCNGVTCGTVFKTTPGGTLTTLYSFCAQINCTDGANPKAGLVLGTDGNFYGTTSSGGAYGGGTVFKITPGRVLTTIYSFCAQTNCTDGSFPYAGLVQATNGNFYGTTEEGGLYGWGTIFEITTSGKLSTLFNFDNGIDGGYPYGTLVQATHGNFYGATTYGGANPCSHGCGTIFKMTPGGTLANLYSFCSEPNCTDGNYPNGLVQATDGNFYGTTNQGGANLGGTVFKITASGKLTTLYAFCSQAGCTDGATSYAGLIQATDGNLYGTTTYGGAYNLGTAFKITTAGTLTTLHSFGSTDGASPQAGLMQATNGNFYGTTTLGGTYDDGTVFSLSVGLGPFVETRPTSSKVGTTVIILGNNLTGSTSVTFNGTGATFTVNSTGTAIKTTVPSGATTGKVKVTTPKGMLTSNVKFRVTPTISSFSPTSGPVGTSVVITGESFTGATSVTFGGVKATSFTVDSDTQITATVPTGAKTGKIGVATPGGTATSTGTFTVT
jgi:uncharacterized repeat protein (TIGR03803 family)